MPDPPDGSVLASSNCTPSTFGTLGEKDFLTQSEHRLDRAVQGNDVQTPRSPLSQLDRSSGRRVAPDSDSHGRADEIGVGEAFPGRDGRSVVPEQIYAACGR